MANVTKGLICSHGHSVGEVERLGADENKRGGPLPAAGTAPIMAEETAGMEPASRVGRTTAAKPEALEPGACGKTARRRETPRQGEAGTLPQ